PVSMVLDPARSPRRKDHLRAAARAPDRFAPVPGEAPARRIVPSRAPRAVLLDRHRIELHDPPFPLPGFDPLRLELGRRGGTAPSMWPIDRRSADAGCA